MGQRSQIYIRYTKDGKHYLTARYFQWNYGERMISRCRHTIEWIKDNMSYDWLFTTNTHKLVKIIDTNFDMKDVMVSSDIVEKWKIYCPDVDFAHYAFKEQANNDGQLYIDVTSEGIKYGLLPSFFSEDKIMSAKRYMNWNTRNWRNSQYIADDQKEKCEVNMTYIQKNAKLMTKEELIDFISCDYENVRRNYGMSFSLLNSAEKEIESFRDKLCEILVEETMSDDNYGLDMSKSVIGTFKACKTLDEFAIADRMLAAMCGWEFDSLIEKIQERDKEGFEWETI